ncbi:ABC transporter permease subunit [Streptomyces sp. ODS28]|uniref:ABC transporter permease subunit n=1 Tax=Streptomyces sp. ODS28 TaxID=3136688 RepID=UPI0031EA530A
MSTVSATRPEAVPAQAPLSAAPFTALLRSEWLKVRSVRALLAALAVIALVTVGFSLLSCATLADSEARGPGFDPVFQSFFGLNFGQAAAISFGAMAVAAEYRDGGIRLSLTAVPHRGRLYAAKLVVVGALCLAVGLITALVSYGGGQALLGAYGVGHGAGGAASEPVAVRAVVGCALYLALIGLCAAGLTTVLRSGAAAMGLLVPFVLLMSFVLGNVAEGGGGVVEFLPDHAGRQILLQHPAGTLGPWSGTAVLAGWTALATGAGWAALRRRDA